MPEEPQTPPVVPTNIVLKVGAKGKTETPREPAPQE